MKKSMKNCACAIGLILIFIIGTTIVTLWYDEYRNILDDAITIDEYPFDSIKSFIPKNSVYNNVRVAVIDRNYNILTKYGRVIKVSENQSATSEEAYSHGDCIGMLFLNSPILQELEEKIEIIFIDVVDDDVSSLVAAMKIALEEKVDVVSISLGTYEDNSDLWNITQKLINNGTIVLSSSGSDATSQYLYPASYEGVISVTCVDANMRYMMFNNANDAISISVPGEKVQIDIEGGVIEKTGSSASCAIAASVISYIKSIDPTITSDIVDQALQKTSVDLGEKGKDDYYGYGLLNMEALVMFFSCPEYRVFY